ncbi:hypothetical protein [Novilysobacter arseniciresistens]|uniref:hypothetical protein n=1 Tax=Novilysobacter arseniciresistens TaxID=1385522 RepID=UPI00068E1BE9|nr:hypothetical protein [Lysobacter arseniciresistens]
MSQATLRYLIENFPLRPTLRVEEVAHVLGKKNTRGAIQRVRQRMTDGVYPNARKVDGIWQLPIEELAEIMEPTPEHARPSLPLPNPKTAPSRTGRRRGEVGPRVGFIRAAQFWVQVFNILGYPEDASDLENQANTLRMEGRLARDIARSEEHAAALDASTPQPPTSGSKPIRRP